MKQLLGEFREFIMRGNVVDLAIAVVVGAAFSGIVDALVKDLIMPIIGIFGGQPNFDSYWFAINGSQIKIGSFITAVVNFLIIAAVIFFFVLKPLNALLERRKKAEEAAPTTRECPYCFTEIPIQATRCPNCTSEVVPVTVSAKAQ